MNGEILKRRVKAVRSLMRKKQIACLVATKPANVTYVTGFLGHDSWAVITNRSVYLLTDSRYIEQAQKECPSCRIIQRTDPIPEAAAKLLKKLKSIKPIAIEKSISVADFGALKKNAGIRLKTATDIIESVRSIKDTTELNTIRSAVRISAQALNNTLKRAKTGMTENELAGMLDLEFRRLGGRNGFDTILAFGTNASRPHHQPSGRKLKKNDAILVDFGAEYKNYRCDMTRCFSIGRPNAFFEKVYKVVEEAQHAAIKMIRHGADMKQVDAAARQVIARYDLPVYQHGSGHGFGLEIHENPFLSPKSKGKLQAGMVLTIEPGVYIPGKLGVRLEDNVLVTKNGCKILTRNCPHSTSLPGR